MSTVDQTGIPPEVLEAMAEAIEKAYLKSSSHWLHEAKAALAVLPDHGLEVRPIEERTATLERLAIIDKGVHDLLKENRSSRAENARLREAYAKTSQEVEQILAQTLGIFPWYADDQKNFPGATRKDGVCVGDLVAEDLARLAVQKIERLWEALEAAQEDLMNGDEAGALRIIDVALQQPEQPAGAQEPESKVCPVCGGNGKEQWEPSEQIWAGSVSSYTTERPPEVLPDCPECGGSGREPEDET